jgi:hypothetical protein
MHFFCYACFPASVQCGCYECVEELVLFYIGDWGVCAAISYSVSNIVSCRPYIISVYLFTYLCIFLGLSNVFLVSVFITSIVSLVAPYVWPVFSI